MPASPYTDDTTAHSRRLRAAGAGMLASAVAAAVLTSVPAYAAPAAPQLTGPYGSVSSTPQISWSASSGATGYEVQVDDSADFSSPLYKAATVNRVAAPTSPLPIGTLYYRVRARDAAKNWSSWREGEFDQAAAAGPTLVGPADGTLIERPADDALLSWSAIPGASSYTVEFDTEDDFIGASSATTKSTTLATPTGQKAGVTYYWRVRATVAKNIFGDWSATSTYALGELPTPVITGPADASDVTDVALDWNPVPGASHYEVQVDDDRNFSSLETGVPSKITATRWSPVNTFVNRQYFWRVRAVDADGNTSAWATAADGDWAEFNRVWRDVPTLVHPVDTAVAPDAPFADRAVVETRGDLYYEWTPVEHASHYELQVSTSSTFEANVTKSCRTVNTTFTAGLNDGCRPGAEGSVVYWRVLAHDEGSSGSVDGILSAAQGFRTAKTAQGYDVKFVFPATDGQSVRVPTIAWEQVPATRSYSVVIVDATERTVASGSTTATTWTPTTALDPAKGPFRAKVTATDANGVNSITVLSDARFTVDPTLPASGLAPLEPATTTPDRLLPQFAWGEFPGADHYRINIKKRDASGWLAASMAAVLRVKSVYPTVTSTDLDTDIHSVGVFEWRVQAFNAAGTELATGPTATYEVTLPSAPTGHRVALSGSALDAGDTCTKTLTAGTGQWCDNLPQTPVLDWNHVEGASHYYVYLSRDEDFTTGLLDGPVRTTNSRWIPDKNYNFPALQESQALSAYYWYVQTCFGNLCSPDPRNTISPAKHAFRKISPAVQLTAPAHQSDPTRPNAVVSSTEVQLSWKQYLETSQATVHAESRVASTQSARTYEVQVAAEPTFAKPLSTAVVDQPFYTAPTIIYPEGPLHWRVRAIDGAKNLLPWSATRTFVKQSPSPVLTSPAAGARTTALTPFSWKDMPYTASWTLQVAKNGDTNFSSANLVVNRSGIRRSTWATGSGTKLLPSSTTPYVWRVRQVFAGNVVGAWSQPRQFTVGAAAPVQTAPAVGVTLDASTVVLRFSPVATAYRHKVQYRQVGATGVTSVVTSGVAAAPTSALEAGKRYEWRVQALDPDQSVMSSTGWRQFVVKATPKPPVVKATTKTVLTVPKKVKAKNGKAAATVTVKVTGGAKAPRGTVKIYAKGKVVGKGSLSSRGTVKIKLKKLNVGSRKLTAKYVGSATHKSSKGKKKTLRIVR